MSTTHAGRTFDWISHHDEHSRRYAVAEHLAKRSRPRRKLWKPGAVLDQGNEGACSGFGAAGDAAAEPMPVPGVTDEVAQAWYQLNKRADEWPGEDYDGSSVLAAMKVGRQLGMWAGYRWAFGITDVQQAILQLGPVIIGVPWHSGMYDAPGGVLTVTGDLVGGHCLLVIGYDPKAPELGGDEGFQLLNSWGPDWGVDGTAWIRATDLAELLKVDGEAAIPVDRRVGKLPTLPRAAAHDPVAGGAPERTTLHVTAAELQPGDRVELTGGDVLGQDTHTVRSTRLVSLGGQLVVVVYAAAGRFRLRPGEAVTVRRAVA